MRPVRKTGVTKRFSRSVAWISKFAVAKEIVFSLAVSLKFPVLLLTGALVVGTTGYSILGGDEYDLLQCAFMTVITLTTIGYGEVIKISDNHALTIYTMILGIGGMGIVLYSLSAVTAVLVRGEVRRIRKRAWLMNEISEMQDHIIVCGVGTTGRHVVRELDRSGADFVLIDPDEDVEKEWPKRPVLLEDATREETLEKAAVHRAKGLIACLSNDKDNVLLVLAARILNPTLVIIARGIEAGMPEKLYRAGANYVVVPPEIGGMRIASQMLRPNVVSFLDRMLPAKGEVVRVEEVEIQAGSSIAGKRIDASRIHEEAGLTVIAMRKPRQETFTYNPGPEDVLEPGMVVLVIGTPKQHEALARMARG